MTAAGRKPYHHGDLRARLLDVADRLLDEGGVGAVSLRETARRVGVTAPATYRHFADKEALLAALAARAFDAFGETLALAAKSADGDPLAGMAHAYVHFALERPGRFRLMFGPTLADRSRYPELEAAVARASVGFRAELGRKAGARQTVEMLRAWSLVHGLTHLLLDGMLPGQDPDALLRELAR